MAYVNNIQDDDDEQLQQQGSEKVLTPESGTVNQGPASGSGAAGSAAATPKPKNTGWTNLQQYIKANDGNDARMGQAATTRVAQKAGEATQAGQSYASAAADKVRQGSVVDNGIVADVKDSPETIVNDQTKREQFQKQLNATYAGPQDFTDVDGFHDTASKYRATASLADAAQSSAGRETLLADVYKRPDYTAGERRLDSFILGSGDAGQQATRALKTSYGAGSQFVGGWDALKNVVSGDIDRGRATTEATRRATQNAVASKDQELQSYFDATAKEVQAKNDAQTQTYQKLASGDRQALKDVAGLDDETIDYLTDNNYDWRKIAAANAAYSLGDVADQRKATQYGALMDLVGLQRKYDLAKAGGRDTTLDTAQKSAALQAAGLTRRIADKIASVPVNVNANLANGKASDAEISAALGLSAAEVAWLKARGVSPTTLLSAGQQITQGGVAGEDISAYDSLANQLGIDSAYGLDTVLGTNYDVNAQLVDAARGAKTLDDAIKSKLGGAVYNQNLNIASGKATDAEIMKALGLNSVDLKWAREHGVDPRTLVGAGRKITTGTVAGDEISKYDALASMLGAGKYNPDEVLGYNYDPDAQRVSSLKGAAALEDALKTRLARDQKKRANEWADISRLDEKALKKLGLTSTDAWLMKRFGFDPAGYLARGRDLALGDVARDDERTNWGSLLQTIGTNSNLDLRDAGDEGAAYTFDKDTAQRNLAIARQWQEFENINSGLNSFKVEDARTAYQKLGLNPDVATYNRSRWGVTPADFLTRTSMGYAFDQTAYNTAVDKAAAGWRGAVAQTNAATPPDNAAMSSEGGGGWTPVFNDAEAAGGTVSEGWRNTLRTPGSTVARFSDERTKKQVRDIGWSQLKKALK